MPKLYDYICEQCGKPFQNRKKNKKFCSVECMYENRKQKRLKENAWTEEIRFCQECGKSFKPVYKPQKYCSKSCSMFVRGREKTKTNTYQTKCSWCEKEFTRILSQKGKTGDFCSVKCGEAFKRGYQDKYIKKTCPKCNKEFKCLYRKQTIFCSYSCSKSGENHPYYGKIGPTKGMKPWVYGLTKETDGRIANLGKKISKTLKQQFKEGIKSSKGRNNPNHNETRKQKERTPEQLERYSKASIKRVELGQVGGQCERGEHTSSKAEGIIKYKSSYELKMLELLERDQNVTFYEYEPFSIKYTDKNRYVPDLLVYYSNKTPTLIEIKGWINDKEQFELKKEAAEEYCRKRNMEYKVFTLKEIQQYEQQLGIINEQN